MVYIFSSVILFSCFFISKDTLCWCNSVHTICLGVTWLKVRGKEDMGHKVTWPVLLLNQSDISESKNF